MIAGVSEPTRGIRCGRYFRSMGYDRSYCAYLDQHGEAAGGNGLGMRIRRSHRGFVHDGWKHRRSCYDKSFLGSFDDCNLGVHSLVLEAG